MPAGTDFVCDFKCVWWSVSQDRAGPFFTITIYLLHKPAIYNNNNN